MCPMRLADQLALVRDRLPELLALSLQQPALPAHIYQYVPQFPRQQSDTRAHCRVSSDS